MTLQENMLVLFSEHTELINAKWKVPWFVLYKMFVFVLILLIPYYKSITI